MSYIIDACLLALFAASVIFAAKKGIFLVLSDLAAAAVALLGAKFMGDRFAPVIYEKNIRGNVTVYLNGVFADSGFTADNIKTKLSDAFGFLPKGVHATLFGENGIDFSSIDYTAYSSIESLEKNIICPVVTMLIKAVIYIVIFIILVIIIRLVLHFIIKHMTPRPLKTVSCVLGGVFGAVKGAVYVAVAAGILIAVSYTYEPLNKFVGDSLICGFLADHLNITNILS